MEHPHTILAAANLAFTYHSQGQWSEAEKLQVEVLEQSRRLLGMEHTPSWQQETWQQFIVQGVDGMRLVTFLNQLSSSA